MKIDRQSRNIRSPSVKLEIGAPLDKKWCKTLPEGATASSVVLPIQICISCLLAIFIASNSARAETPGSGLKAAGVSQPRAAELLDQTIQRLANGPAFNAKVRQRVWAMGREVVGIGTYEQAGYGSGRFNLQMAMLDGSGKHTLQQISDGRLAWTRTVIAENVSLRRVDVGRLDEWIPAQARQAGRWRGGFSSAATKQSDSQSAKDPGLGSVAPTHSQPTANVAPRLVVGAWTELLDTIRRDHVLRLGTSQIESQPVLVVTGNLRDSVRRQVASTTAGSWPEMYPTTVKVAIAAVADAETGFGEGLPVRFEYWSDSTGEFQGDSGGASGSSDASRSDDLSSRHPRLISLIELFAIHPMTAPPLERFRFENQDAEVNFVNETDQYLRRYGVRITDSQRRLLLR